MTAGLRPIAEPLTNDGRAPAVLAWADARQRIADARYYWIGTTHPGGRAQIRPVLAVWVGDALCTTSHPAARKTRNLAHDPHCSIAVTAEDMHLVVEGTATKVVAPQELAAVADAYRAKYDWPITVTDGLFEAPYGAPTAGLPPYQPFRITPEVGYAFVNDDSLGPASTRWQFTNPAG